MNLKKLLKNNEKFDKKEVLISLIIMYCEITLKSMIIPGINKFLMNEFIRLIA